MGRSGLAHLEPYATVVDGRAASYHAGGSGFPVVFLHGWGLAERSYRRALKRLIMQGCRVYAPALPGFGGTADLPSGARSLVDYAAWVDAFLTAVGIEGSALVVGHSFGGGVATRLAYDFPARVRYLVLLNSVGAPPERRDPFRALVRAVREPLPIGEGVTVLRAAAQDLVPNLLRHPRTMIEIGMLARRADLSFELVELAKRDLPVLVLWGENDRVLPVGAFEALCNAIGSDGTVVHGNHSWVLADPDTFGEVMANVVEIAGLTELQELTQSLEATSMPPDVVASLVGNAAPLWLMSEPPPTLAGDLALCYPPLRPGEIRAVARACGSPGLFRLTIVAHDRPGLLADTTAVLAAEQLSVVRASATTWTADGLAMHSLVVQAPPHFLVVSWEGLAERLRGVAANRSPGFLFEPDGRADVRSTPQALGRSVLSVAAHDQLGLLWAICAWLADHGVTIEAMHAQSVGDMARDQFVVRGPFDPDALRARLSMDTPTHLMSTAVDRITRLLTR